MIFDWTQAYAERAKGLGASDIAKAIAAAADPRLISLAGGVPAPELFPEMRFRAAFARVLRDNPHDFLQYGCVQGHPPLRAYLADRLAWCGVRATAEQLVITNGSQQGIDLVAKLLLNPGDHVVVDDPSYLGALETFRQYQVRFTVIPTDAEGTRVDILEDVLRRDRAEGGPHRIRMAYTVPNFANPTGVTMSMRRREAYVALSHRYSLPVVEDDAYGELRYDGRHLPSLAGLDDVGTVIYLGTLSKILAPGLRVGWIAGHKGFIEPLTHLKERADLHSPTGAQQVICDIAADGFLEGHVKQAADTYRERRDAAAAAVATFFPASVSATTSVPDGGFFVWSTLPPGVDSKALLIDAMTDHGVAFVPGDDFFAGGNATGALRLSYSTVPPSRIHEAVRRLGAALHDAVGARP